MTRLSGGPDGKPGVDPAARHGLCVARASQLGREGGRLAVAQAGDVVQNGDADHEGVATKNGVALRKARIAKPGSTDGVRVAGVA